MSATPSIPRPQTEQPSLDFHTVEQYFRSPSSHPCYHLIDYFFSLQDTALLKRISLPTDPPTSRMKRLVFLFHGAQGAGKSSLSNTLRSVFREELSYIQDTSIGNVTHTTKFTPWTLHDSIPILGVDSWGWSTSETDTSYTRDEFNYMLAGRVPAEYEGVDRVDSQPFADTIRGPSHQNNDIMVIDCVIFVVASASVPDIAIRDAYINRLNKFIKQAKMRGIPYVIALTRTDSEYPSRLGNMPHRIPRDTVVREKISRLAELTDTDPNHIFPTTKYINRRYKHEDIDLLALQLLKAATSLALERNALQMAKSTELWHDIC